MDEAIAQLCEPGIARSEPPATGSEVTGPSISPTEQPAAERAASPQDYTFDVLAHVEDIGDVRCRAADWVGVRGSGKRLEGFAATPIPGLLSTDLSYQVIQYQWYSFGLGTRRRVLWQPRSRTAAARFPL